MNNLEQNLREYLDTRETIAAAAVAEVGRAGAHEAVAEQRMIADLRAIMDGRPLPGSGAE